MIEHIRGGTFAYMTSVPEAYSDSTARSQVRDPGGKLWADLVCEWQGPAAAGIRMLSIRDIDGTDDWPIGTLYMDVRFTLSDGSIQPTKRLSISVLPGVTR